jgi:pyrophosphatase PpaX
VIVREWVGPDRAEEAVARLYTCYERAFSGTRPFPGILDLMRTLRDGGRRVGLFTGRGRPSTDRLLAGAGLAPWIEGSVTGDEVPHSKPAPDGLLALTRAFSVQPRDLVYVGDSPLDLQAADAAGVAFLGVAWADGIEPITDPRAVVLRTVGDLSRLLLGDR